MTVWLKQASEEITDFARSGKLGAGEIAGQLYETAKQLTPQRAENLPKLAGKNPDIRWWDFGSMTIYFRVDPPPITVVKVGQTRTAYQRDTCESDARERS